MKRGALLLMLIHLWGGPVSAQGPLHAAKALELERAAREERAKAIEARAGQPVSGRVVEDARGKPAIATPEGLLIPLGNPDALRNAPKGLSIRLDVQQVDGAFRAGEWKTEIANSWDRIKGRYPVGR